ncbi:uncharacterized protein FIBRA_04380 [Fibroporia radiculosa]|uniref:YDG domain-containing protein n=1 Tax=Fibroporia radiculosa TaxID=599839 RepID=J4HWH9_9APHY|nr:uncharacterized protein FIBRA_04380 [Fibroporia radiculosa]CCM02292.1 predicted protein [Fibroporia radiculosa]
MPTMGIIRRPLPRHVRDPAVFGHIPDVPVGTRWGSRQECSNDGVHPSIMAGICGRQETGAYSVALSGGYEDDVDEGNTFTYTGCGGRDTGGDKKLRTGPQAYDQSFDNPKNRALKVSVDTGRPVRVIRGFKLDSNYAPAEGYRYDGLYKVTEAWLATGKAGYKVCRYRFVRLPDQPPIPRREGNFSSTYVSRPRHYSPIPEPKYEGTAIPKMEQTRQGSSSTSSRPSVPTSSRAGSAGAGASSSSRRPLKFTKIQLGTRPQASSSNLTRAKRRRDDPIPEPKFEGYYVAKQENVDAHTSKSFSGQ